MVPLGCGEGFTLDWELNRIVSIKKIEGEEEEIIQCLS